MAVAVENEMLDTMLDVVGAVMAVVMGAVLDDVAAAEDVVSLTNTVTVAPVSAGTDKQLQALESRAGGNVCGSHGPGDAATIGTVVVVLDGYHTRQPPCSWVHDIWRRTHRNW